MNERMRVIDGSQMESGGQILRMSAVFSCLLRIPLKIYNIRKKRSKPGLMAQHLAGLELIAQMSNCDLINASLGSMMIQIVPRDGSSERGGDFAKNTHTAGSVGLLHRDASLERAGNTMARAFKECAITGVDRNLEDNLIVFMALADGISEMTCCANPTLHTLTAIYVAEELTGAKFDLRPVNTDSQNSELCKIVCCGSGFMNRI
ncbi:hypothetical protein ACOME3_006134 [Neoechinorhynchus agilis]